MTHEMPDDPLPVVIALPCVDGVAAIAFDDRPARRELKAAEAALSHAVDRTEAIRKGSARRRRPVIALLRSVQKRRRQRAETEAIRAQALALLMVHDRLARALLTYEEVMAVFGDVPDAEWLLRVVREEMRDAVALAEEHVA